MLFKMIGTKETFKKTERLCSRKTIALLFESGNVFHFSYYKVIWLKSPVQIPSPAQVLFSIPKMGFRHAVVRNLIKRRMREAYRKKKFLLYEFLRGRNICVAMIIIFRGNSVPDYQSVEKSIDEIFKKLILMIADKEK